MAVISKLLETSIWSPGGDVRGADPMPQNVIVTKEPKRIDLGLGKKLRPSEVYSFGSTERAAQKRNEYRWLC